jgi:hypothetical protein
MRRLLLLCALIGAFSFRCGSEDIEGHEDASDDSFNFNQCPDGWDWPMRHEADGDAVCAGKPDCHVTEGATEPPLSCPNICSCLCYDELCYPFACTLYDCDEPAIYR